MMIMRMRKNGKKRRSRQTGRRYLEESKLGKENDEKQKNNIREEGNELKDVKM